MRKARSIFRIAPSTGYYELMVTRMSIQDRIAELLAEGGDQSEIRVEISTSPAQSVEDRATP